jgi:hypothetical protein|tara:strand:- start:2317 stop:2604 length:288 start_codon:yes stop_codon:yes gene_type:complete
MARKKAFRGSVNHIYAVSGDIKKKQTKFGKNYSSIDFEMSDRINENNYRDKSLPIGLFKVGDREFELTSFECNKIISTLENALSIHDKKIKLGIK